MKPGAKFGIIHALFSLGFGFMVSALSVIALYFAAPQVLIKLGGGDMGAGSLEDGMKGEVIAFLGLGILLSVVMALILATLIKRKSKDKSSDGWWPVPR
ncbi:MAG TPA: hypothetical protein VJW20_22570 [Candidatus Angelobacter sp.]|nr:hypothetical protein [Candidatus Angelobacter sp.]